MGISNYRQFKVEVEYQAIRDLTQEEVSEDMAELAPLSNITLLSEEQVYLNTEATNMAQVVE